MCKCVDFECMFQCPPRSTKKNLYPGCPITVDEWTMMVFAYALRHQLSKVAISDLLQMFKFCFPEDISLPGSQYLLEKNLDADYTKATKCFFCHNCEQQVETANEVCANCQAGINASELVKSGKYFLMFDVSNALRGILDLKEVSHNLMRNLRQKSSLSLNNDIYTDIVDGECYRNLGLTGSDFTCSINTDGVNVFRSSQFSIWPIFVSINELDYKVRRKHTLLVGLWFGLKKPSFDTFLTPFVTQCKLLSDEGLTWKYNGVEIISHVFFPIIAADSAARPRLQGIKQYNGHYSCPWCLEKGEMCHLNNQTKPQLIFPPLSICESPGAIARAIVEWGKERLLWCFLSVSFSRIASLQHSRWLRY